jgi:predicted nucleic acid-binding protein
MSKYVLDASAVLRYLDREPGFETVKRLLKESLTGETEVLMSAVNWGEVVYVLMRAHPGEAGRELAGKLRSTPLQIVPADIPDSEGAAIFKQEFNVPYADAFAGNLALREAAVLVTADFDFKRVPNHVLKIEFLPEKKSKGSKRN